MRRIFSTLGALAFGMVLASEAFAQTPPVPTQFWPRPSATLSNTETTFHWSAITNPANVTYRLQISSSLAFDGIIRDITGLTANFHTLSGTNAIPAGTTFYWRVITTSPGGETSQTPGSAITIRPNAIEYDFELSTDNTFATLVNTRHVEEPMVTLLDSQPIIEGTNYWWRVRAIDKAGNSTINSQPFILRIGNDIFPPPLPRLHYPLDNAIVANALTPFDWSDVSDASLPVEYTLEIATDAGFVNQVVTQAGIAASTYTLSGSTMPSQALARGTVYYWRVRVRDGLGNNQATVARTLTINAKTIKYDLEVGRTAGLANPDLTRSGLAAVEYATQTAEGFLAGPTYFWRVRAVDPAGNPRLSAESRFGLADNFAPTEPVKIYPALGATIVNKETTFDWSDSLDNNGAVYTLQIASDAGFVNLLLNRPDLDASTYTLTPSDAAPFVRGTTYYWRLLFQDELVPPNQGEGTAQAYTLAAKSVRYRLRVSTDQAFQQNFVLDRDALPDLSYAPIELEGLQGSGPYFWRVDATDLAGNTRQNVYSGATPPAYAPSFVIGIVDAFAPPIPVVIYPASGRTVLNRAPTFDWSTVTDDNQVRYAFEIAIDEGFVNIVHSSSDPTGSAPTLTDSNYTVPVQLTRGTTYYWRLRVADLLGNTQTGPTQTVIIDAKAMEYRIEISDNDTLFTPNNLHTSVGGIAGTQYVLNAVDPLTAGTRYYWRVRATDPAGNFEGSRGFFTLQLADTFAPSLPTYLYPQTGAIVANDRPVFDWTNSIDPNGVTYTIQVATDTGFINTVVNEDTTSSDFQVAANALVRGTTYFWRVNVRDGSNNAQNGPTATFTLNGKAPLYTLQVSTGSGFTANDIALSRDRLAATSYTTIAAEGFTEGRQYWWRVLATDSAGNSSPWATAFRFRLADEFAPLLPTLLYPASNATVLNPQIGFVWTNSTDPNGVAYALEIATDAGFVNIVRNKANLAIPSVGLDAGEALSRGTTYYWRVRVTDGLQNTDVTPTRALIVDPKALAYGLTVVDTGSNISVISQNQLSGVAYETPEVDSFTAGVVYRWSMTATDPAGNTGNSSGSSVFSLADVFAPEPAVHLYPGDGLTVINPETPFDWSAANEPNVTYVLEIATDSGFVNVIRTQAGITTSSYVLTNAQALDRGATYYWRLTSTDGSNNSATDTPTSFILDAKAPQYRFTVATDATLTQNALVRDGLSSPQYVLLELERLMPGIQYYWGVTATDRSGNARPANAVFRVRLADTYAPDLPTLLYPLDTNIVLNNLPAFDWSDANEANVRFTLELATDSGFTNIALSRGPLTQSSYVLQPGEELVRGTQYYWRVTTSDLSNNSASTVPYRVTIDPKAMSYDLSIRNLVTNTVEVSRSNINGESYPLAELEAVQAGVRYEWTVQASDPSGNSVGAAAAFQFELADTFAPDPPRLLYPVDGVTVINPSVTFDWADVGEPVAYDMQVATDATFTNRVIDVPALPTSDFSSAAPLARGVTYYWRVGSTDGAGNRSQSVPQTFVLDAKAVNYRLTIAENAGLTQNPLIRNNLTDNAYTLITAEQLSPGPRYYWTVEATDPAGNMRPASGTFQLQLIDSFAPDLPTLRYPVNSGVTLTTFPMFDWTDATENGVNYSLQVATDSGFTNTVINAQNLAVSSYQTGSSEGLNRGATYYWRVGVADGAGNSQQTAANSVTVDAKAVSYDLTITVASSNLVHATQTALQAAEYALSEVQRLDSGVRYLWNVTSRDPAGNVGQSSGQFALELADSFAPDIPVLLYPADAATILTREVTFDWADSAEANVTFGVQVATDANFTNMLVNVTGLTASNYTVAAGQLNRGEQYYWRISVTDANNNSANGPTRTVNIHSKASRYRLTIALNQALTLDPLVRDNLTDAAYHLQEAERLDPGVNYYWGVGATDAAGNTVNASAVFLLNLNDTFAPDLPRLLYPAAAVTVLNPTLTFDWSDATESNATFALEVATDNAFTATIISQGNLTASSHTLTGAQAIQLSRGGQYYWRVRIADALNNSATTPSQSFVLDPKRITYELNIVEANSAVSHVSRPDIPGNSYLLSSLEAVSENVRYRWSVIARDPAGNAVNSSASFEFQLADQFAPTLPQLTYPALEANVLNPEVTFDWSDSTDATAVQYRLQVATDATFTQIIRDVPNLTASNASLTGMNALTRGARYYWRLIVSDSPLNNTAMTPQQSFVIAARSTRYRLEIAENDSFTQGLRTHDQLAAEEYALLPGEELDQAQDYYWRVQAEDPAGNFRASTSTFILRLDDRFAPTEPTLIYPVDTATLLNPRVTFDWSDSVDANGVSYRLQVASDAGFSQLVVDEGMLATSSLGLSSALPRGARYYWRVGFVDNLGNADFTDGRFFDLPVKGIEYSLEIATDAGFGVHHLNRGAIAANEYALLTIEQLDPGPLYYWRVRAVDASGNATASTANFFRVQLADQFPPSQPVHIYPRSGEAVANANVVFDWSNAIDGSPVQYTLHVSTNNSFTSTVALVTGLTTSSHALQTPLARGGTYFWRVRSIDQAGNEGWSVTYNPFTGIWANPPEFEVATKGVTYRVEVANDMSFSSLHEDRDRIVPNEFQLLPGDELVEATSYYWRVTATDGAGNGRPATNNPFLLSVADTFAPSLPVHIYPKYDANVANPLVGFDWSDSTDPSGVTYTLQIATDANFNSIILSQGGLGTSFYQLQGGQALTRGQQYYWRLGVSDNQNNAAFGQGTPFTIHDKAVSYRLDIARDAQLSQVEVTRLDVIGTSYALQPAEAVSDSTTYWWRVTASNASGLTTQSSSDFIFSLADVFAPVVPAMLYPVHTSVIVNPNPTFDWVDANDTNAVTYRFQLSDDPNFGSFIVDQGGLATSGYTHTGAALTRWRDYYWRVEARDSQGNFSVSDTQQFRLNRKLIFYELEISTDQTFANIEIRRPRTSSTTTVLPPTLALSEGTDYYWRVTAYDAASNPLLAQNGPFLLRLQDSFAPTLPTLLYPADQANMLNPTVTFDWSNSSDPSGVTYGFELATDANFTSIVAMANNLNPSTFTVINPLTRLQNYWWRITVTDNLNNTMMTPARAFRVAPKSSYFLEVANDANFTNYHYTQQGIEGTEHVLSSTAAVVIGQNYWWRVSNTDGAGNAIPSTSSFVFRVELPGLTTASVIPRTQPERADYEFAATRPNTNWTLTLTARDGMGNCGRLVHRRTQAAQQSITGTFPGLSPGASYCWMVTATDDTGTITADGDITIPALPTFTVAPTYTRSGIEVDVAATVSVASTGVTQWSVGTCASAGPSAVQFDGNDVIQLPGDVFDNDEFALEAWVRLPAANQNSQVLFAEGGSIDLDIVNGALRVFLNTTGGQPDLTTSSPLPVGAWTHIVASFGVVTAPDKTLRLFVDGVNQAGATHNGVIIGGANPAAIIGNFTNGFQGQIAQMAIYNRALTTSEAQAGANGGVNAPLPPRLGQRAFYRFDEGTAVQSVYDATGNNYSGVFGQSHLGGEQFDPTRLPAFTQTTNMNTGTALAVRLTNMPGGPEYCGRVQATDASGITIVSTIVDFTRNTDLEDPMVIVDPLNITAECTGNSQATFVVDEPQVSDDVTSVADLVVESRVNGRTGAVIDTTTPPGYAFPFGVTNLHWSARDEAGNTGWGDTPNGPQVIRIVDNTPPSVTPGGIDVVEATSPSGTPYTPTPAAASDTCTNVTVSHAPAGPYALGDHLITFTVRDQALNPTTAQRTLRIQDTTPPDFVPALASLTVGKPAGCFMFVPPTPTVSDNGFVAADITITGQRITGAGLPGACWEVGDHVYRWTISDPRGNVRTGDQTITIATGDLAVVGQGITVPGVTNPTTGRYYNQSVTLNFSVSGGDGQYAVTVSPVPNALTNVGNNYAARYDAEGAFPLITVVAQDGMGMGTNFGSNVLAGFGIDRTAPVVDAAIIDQANVVLANTATFPYVFGGEFLNLQEVMARDGNAENTNLGTAVVFDGTDDIITIPHTNDFATTGALTIEAWVYVEAFADGTIIAKADDDGDEIGYELSIRQNGRARFRLQVDGSVRTLNGGQLTDRTWHHIAATFDGAALRMYVDGLPSATQTFNGAVNLGTAATSIGATVVGAAAPANVFSGRVGQIVVWRTTRDEAELRLNYAGGYGRQVAPDASQILKLDFIGNDQSVPDTSGRGNSGFLGASNAADTDDPTRLVLTNPNNPASSGLERVTVSFVHVGTNRTSQMISVTNTPAGTPLAVGERQVAGQVCTAAVGGVCNAGSELLLASQIFTWNSNNAGAFRIVVEAVDAAGNVTTGEAGVRTSSYNGALQLALDGTIALRAGNPFDDSLLSEAQDAFQEALAYSRTSPRYADGSYLRAEQGIEALISAWSDGGGDDVGRMPEYVARGLGGEIQLYVNSLSTNLHPDDQDILANGEALIVESRFNRYRGSYAGYEDQANDAFDGYDAVALLYPPYQPMRQRLRAARTRWQDTLTEYGNGGRTVDSLRNDGLRLITLQQLIGATRSMLSDVIYAEVGAVLALNPPEQQTLNEIRDVIDKSSSSLPDEVGDLIAISNLGVTDACLDLLANLRLDDETFTRCYLRLNDLAQFFGTTGLTESLIHTNRWQAGIAAALFNMLDLSLYLGPQGVPWVTSGVAYTTPGDEVLVLPDAQAANVTGSVAVSTVDQADMALATAYGQHAAALQALDDGNSDAAFQIFRTERCLLLNIYNRYYTTNAAQQQSVSAPMDTPIDPMSVGCAP